MEFNKEGFITKMELLEILEKLNFVKRNLQFYIDEGLIDHGISEYFPGISGAVSFYSDKIPAAVHAIQELVSAYKLTLKEIKKYKDAIYKFNGEAGTFLKSNEIEIAKFRTALKCFAAAEASVILCSTVLPLIRVTEDEIRVTFKEMIDRNNLHIDDDIETRFTAELILLTRGIDGAVKPEEQAVLDKLKTIKEVIFKAGSVEVL